MKTLFLATTPLHALISLGLMRGPYRHHENTLALINRQGQGRLDVIAAAVQCARPAGVSVVQFPRCRHAGLGPGRRLLTDISEITRQLSPSVIATGNDRRPEFYAAVRGCPTARRVYVDDGLYSYIPNYEVRETVGQGVAAVLRRLWSGIDVERPSLTGGSRAVQEGYVLLPDRVHEGLRGKPVRALQPEWFADPAIRAICEAAMAQVGLAAARCRSIGLLIILPHPRLLSAYPALRDQVEGLAARHARRGEVVALKSHPEAGIALDRQLRLPDRHTLEIPAGLPVEA
ncbi:MAG: hypothetical protein K2X42_04980, partial [Burkholderiaceae bacterium]|nr:hypothetical protein [Burkholderiaceae bacterium]